MIDWQAVSAVADVVGVIVVAPSLVYLALQVRQNTRQMRASATNQYFDASKDLNLALIASTQTASVYRRGVADFDALDEDEKTQFFFYIAQFYQSFSNMHDLWTEKTLPDSAWHPIRKHLISMMALPGARHVWEAWAREGLAPAFVAYVDGLAASGEATYSLEQMLSGRPAAASAGTGGEPRS